MIIHRCDTCKKETEKTQRVKAISNFRVKEQIVLDYDLCTRCLKKLKQWVEDKPNEKTN